MPYVEHPVFAKPADPDAPLWRFVDFTKFVSLLDRRALFFTRADKLGDRFEGSMSRANLAMRPEVYKEIPDDEREEVLRKFASFVRALVARTFINCWTAADHESAAMWRLYVGSGTGVAIRSSFARLTESIGGEEHVMIGKVNYADYERDFIPEGNSLGPFVFKRRAFEYEREVRAVIQPLDSTAEGTLDLRPHREIGLYVPVDLDRLIEEVRVNPAAGQWFLDLVGSVTRLYGIELTVRQSDLTGEPVY